MAEGTPGLRIAGTKPDAAAHRIVGTEQMPAQSKEPMKVARDLVRNLGARQRLWYWRGEWLIYRDDRWRALPEDVLEGLVWGWLEDFRYERMTADGPVVTRLAPTTSTVSNVMAGLRSVCQLESEKIPMWTGKAKPPFDPRFAVAFPNGVLDVGTMVLHERPEEWLDPGVLTVPWDPAAKAPRWEKALTEWSDGEEAWKELLLRFMGYSLMSWRGLDRLLFMYGKVRSGKSTIADLLKSLLPSGQVMNIDMREVGGQFGLDGLQTARVLAVREVQSLDGRDAEAFVATIKNIVGRDQMTINVKYQRQQRNVTVAAAPILISNEMLKLPNKGRGLSSKVLAVPFMKSFEKHPDPFLPETLMGELAGIAASCMRAANRLVKDVTSGKGPAVLWPQPEHAAEVMRRFHLLNNPCDAFLGARFEAHEEGFVTGERIWKEWLSWKKQNHIDVRMPRTQIMLKLEDDSTWELSRGRRQGVRGLKGLRLKGRDHVEDQL